MRNDRNGWNFDPKVTGSDITKIVPKIQLIAQQTLNWEPFNTIVTLQPTKLPIVIVIPFKCYRTD